MAGDVISIEDDVQPGEPLIQPVMQGGQRMAPWPTLVDIRARAARELERLPESLHRLEPGASYSVQVADALVRLATEVDRRLAESETQR